MSKESCLEKISRINLYKNNIRNKIASLGGAISSSDPLRVYPDKITRDMVAKNSEAIAKGIIENNITELVLGVEAIPASDSGGVEDGYFALNTNLTRIELPNCKSIGTGAFYGCTNLVTVKIGTSNCTLAHNSNDLDFHGCPLTDGIYVPSDYVNSYKSSWSLFASKIKGY